MRFKVHCVACKMSSPPYQFEDNAEVWHDGHLFTRHRYDDDIQAAYVKIVALIDEERAALEAERDAERRRRLGHGRCTLCHAITHDTERVDIGEAYRRPVCPRCRRWQVWTLGERNAESKTSG